MPRRRRSHLPGNCFHVAARTVCRKRWFAKPETRDFIVSALEESLRRTDTEVIAFAIMRNHFHLVLRQGYEPLEVLMSSFMRRIALRVQRDEKHEGHVFEKRFWTRACTTSSYLRNAIIYVHRNPVHAKLCTELGGYNWTSHNAFMGLECGFLSKRGIELFAEHPNQDAETTRAHYVRYAEWRAKVLALRKQSPTEPRPPRPKTTAGDASWKTNFTAFPSKEQFKKPDLRDLVLKTIAEADPPLTLDYIQGRTSTKAIVEVRKEIVSRATDHGYAGIDIARWLKTSPQNVSRIKNELLRNRYVGNPSIGEPANPVGVESGP